MHVGNTLITNFILIVNRKLLSNFDYDCYFIRLLNFFHTKIISFNKLQLRTTRKLETICDMIFCV